MEKILITGASGFVGSHLVEEALGRGLEVFAGVRKSSSRKYLQNARIRFLEMDFADKKNLKEKLKKEKFDYIIHNAGVVSASRPQHYYTVNYEYVKNLIDVLSAEDITPKKFVQMSSLASYGPADANNLSDYLKEERPPRPINTYGKSKLMAEQYIKSSNGLPFIIFRPTAIYGPREKEILTFFKLINKNIEGYIGNKEQHLTFIYVKDLAKTMLDATLSHITNKSYFISDGKYYRPTDLGKYARQLLNKKTIRFRVPVSLVRGIAWVLEQPARITGQFPPLNLEKVCILESANWKCDLAPLKKDLNFQPEYDLRSGLEETLRWYKENGWL